MNDPTPRGNASKQKWTDPAIRQRIIEGQRRYWRDHPGARKQRGDAVKLALASPEVRQRISDGTKAGLADPKVLEKISENSKRTWDGNAKRKQQARETAKQVFGKPDVEQRRREGFARPETREKISKGGKKAWATDGERREQVSVWAAGLWAERKRKLAEAERLLAESKGIDEQTRQLKKLDVVEVVSKKLADPAKYMWLSPAEVAEAFGIALRTFYRNVGRYRLLRKNQKGWYSTASVIEQLKSPPPKK